MVRGLWILPVMASATPYCLVSRLTMRQWTAVSPEGLSLQAFTALRSQTISIHSFERRRRGLGMLRHSSWWFYKNSYILSYNAIPEAYVYIWFTCKRYQYVTDRFWIVWFLVRATVVLQIHAQIEVVREFQNDYCTFLLARSIKCWFYWLEIW